MSVANHKRSMFTKFMVASSLSLVGCAAEPATDEALDEAADEQAVMQPEVFPGSNEPFNNCNPNGGAFTANVTNPYFPLKVCSRTLLQGVEDGVVTAVRITVLDETRVVAGVTTRVVEEYHTEDGELVELSYNYFVQAKGGGIPPNGTVPRNGTVCYYGEHVDIYNDNGTITHEGQWFAGVAGALPGIVMPSIAKVGQAYLQEVAPGLAQDRAWHTKLVNNRLFVTEDTPLEPGHFSHKVYKKGRGLIRDGVAKAVSYEILDEDDCERAEVGDEDEDD